MKELSLEREAQCQAMLDMDNSEQHIMLMYNLV